MHATRETDFEALEWCRIGSILADTATEDVNIRALVDTGNDAINGQQIELSTISNDGLTGAAIGITSLCCF